MDAWTCPFCLYSFFDRDEIKDHISKEHFGVEEALPLIKQEKSEQIQVVPDFVIEDQPVNPFWITNEDTEPDFDTIGSNQNLFKNPEDPQDHQLEVNVQLDKAKLKCQECPKVYTTRKSLTRHVKSAHDNEIFQCNVCDKAFNHKENMRRHMSRVHQDPKPKFKESFFKKFLQVRQAPKLECETCGKLYGSRKALWRHNQTHKGIKYECTDCQKLFSAPDTLRRHIKTVHGNFKRTKSQPSKHACQQCSNSYRDKRDLENHVASVHKGIRITCEHCPTDFGALKSYKRHLVRKHGF